MVPPLASIRGELAFELLDNLVEGGIDVVARSLGSEHVAGRVAGDLYVMAPTDPWVPFDDLDFESRDPGIDPAEFAELVLGHGSDAIGDANAPALEDEIHGSSLPPGGIGNPRGAAAPRKGMLLPG
jgi:hypothetical protein